MRKSKHKDPHYVQRQRLLRSGLRCGPSLTMLLDDEQLDWLAAQIPTKNGEAAMTITEYFAHALLPDAMHEEQSTNNGAA